MEQLILAMATPSVKCAIHVHSWLLEGAVIETEPLRRSWHLAPKPGTVAAYKGPSQAVVDNLPGQTVHESPNPTCSKATKLHIRSRNGTRYQMHAREVRGHDS